MQNANLRGSLLMITAMAFFAVEDMFIKFAAAGMPAGQIIFISGLFGVPVFAAIATYGTERPCAVPPPFTASRIPARTTRR